VTAAELDATRDAARPWPRWQRILFRYLLCHCLLYSLPRPFSVLIADLADGVQFLQRRFDWPWLQAEPIGWPRAATDVLTEKDTPWDQPPDPGIVDEWWYSLTTWMSEHGLTPLKVVVQQTGSGDTAHDWTKLMVIVASSTLLTVLWSMLSSARGYPRLGRWLHLFARWDLAFWMLFYGLIKLYGGQFGTPSLWQLNQELADKSPMGMVWTFMGASKPYEVFSGIGEIAGGLLLFHHRTALLGCLVTIGVMTNVCALNWLYDVPVKLFSLHLLLYAVFLLAPYGERLWALFFANLPSRPVDLKVVRRPWAIWLLTLVGASFVVAHLVNRHFTLPQLRGQRMASGERPALWGLWRVEKMVRDGVEVPITDATRWRVLAIDDGGVSWAREATGRAHWFDVTERLDENRLDVKPRGRGEPTQWTVERATKVVQEAHPAPTTRKEMREPFAVERPTLVVRGRVDGHDVEVHTVQRALPLHRGFHFVQEMPYNR
jgi:hypothetical protein